MPQERKGPLESINVKLEKDQGDSMKKSIDAAKSILDAIGSGASASAGVKK